MPRKPPPSPKDLIDKPPKAGPWDTLMPGRTKVRVPRTTRQSSQDTEIVHARGEDLSLVPSVIRKQVKQAKRKGVIDPIIQAKVSRKTMARFWIKGNDLYRISSVSANAKAGGKVNLLKVYRNGEPLMILPTVMRDPLSYIKKWPKSKWRKYFVGEIMMACGLARDEAEAVLLAPLRGF